MSTERSGRIPGDHGFSEMLPAGSSDEGTTNGDGEGRERRMLPATTTHQPVGAVGSDDLDVVVSPAGMRSSGCRLVPRPPAHRRT